VEQRQARAASPGKLAETHLPRGGFTVKTTLSKQIETAEGERNSLQDKLLEIAETEDRSAEDEVLFGNLPSQIEALDGQIKNLKAAERALAMRATTESTEDDATRTRNGDVTAKRPFAVPAKKLAPRDLIVRGAAIQLLAHINKVPLMEMTKRMYGDDESTMWLMRAATNPAMTTVPTWASELVQTGIADFLNTLPVDSIYRPLSAMGARFSFGRNGVIRVPSRSATPNVSGAFVGEGQPIPVRRLGLTSITMTPKKMGVISTFTRELAAHSTPSIEGIIRDAMGEDTAVTIDTVLLDANPATTIRPAGLLNAVVPIAASAAPDSAVAMVQDIKALISAITASRGGRAIAVLINPSQGIGINFQQTTTGEFLFASASDAGTRLGVTFISSPNVPIGTVIAVDAADFASATGDVPEYDVSDQATIHEEDTAPLPIATGVAGAGVVATPTRSLWQTASLGVRMLLDINWAMRRTGMVQAIVGVTW
jgi:HK97 family phage major capsid protein